MIPARDFHRCLPATAAALGIAGGLLGMVPSAAEQPGPTGVFTAS